MYFLIHSWGWISWYIPRDGLMIREWPYTALSQDVLVLHNAHPLRPRDFPWPFRCLLFIEDVYPIIGSQIGTPNKFLLKAEAVYVYNHTGVHWLHWRIPEKTPTSLSQIPAHNWTNISSSSTWQKSPYLRKNQDYLRKSLHTLECVLPVGQLSGTLCSETGSLRRIHEYEDEYRKLWRHMSSSAGDIPLLYSISAIFENANVSVLFFLHLHIGQKSIFHCWAPERTRKTQDFMFIRFHSLFSCLIVFKQSLIRCWRHPTKMCRISRIKE